MNNSTPSLGVITRWFGVRSQVWMWRQIKQFRQLQPHVLSWTHENQADYPLGDAPIRVMDTPQEPNNSPARWLWRLRNLPLRNLYGSQGTELRVIESQLKQWQCSVLLAHFGHFGLRMLPAAQRLAIPLVVHFHGDDISSALNDRYYRWSLQQNLRKFAGIVCVTTKQRQALLRLGAAMEQIHVIPCGVPTDEFLPVQRGVERPVTFLCVCRLVKWKGVHHIIDAFTRASREMNGCRLVIAGDGPEALPLRNLVHERGLGGVVTFAGSQPPEQIRRLMEEADVFLQHSLTHNGWNEGSSVAIAEASATALPVIVTDSGGNAEQVLDGISGIVVAENDVTTTARAMVTLARDAQLRHRLGAAGRERVVAHFNARSQVEKLESVLLKAGGVARLSPAKLVRQP